MPIGADKFTELPETVNELVADRAIRHALYLERYKTHLVEEILKEFNGKLEPALLAKIEKSLRRVSGTSKQMQALFKDNGVLVREEYKVMEAKLYEQLKEFSEVESSWLVKTLQTQTPIAWNFVAPSPTMLKALVTKQPMEGALVKDWFSKLSADTAFAVNRQIQMGMVEGEGIEKIVRRIKGTRAAKYTDGILNANRNHLRSVVRTSVSHVAHNAREETYKANTDIIKAVQIVATLDTRTCFECMDKDGNVYPVGEGPRPAFHWSCRCSDAPVLRSWKELGIPASEATAGTRASMNGQVPETQTYPEWLKKQSESVQNEALGIERAKRWRAGKEKISQFTDDRNRLVTLERLREKSGLTKATAPLPVSKLSGASIQERRAIAEVSRGNRKGVEKLAYVSGKRIEYATGTPAEDLTQASVMLSPGQRKTVAGWKHVTVIHNHPLEQTFSEADLYRFTEVAGFSKAYVVTPSSAIHTLRLKRGKAITRKQVDAILARKKEILVDDYLESFEAGKISKAELLELSLGKALKNTNLLFEIIR